MLLSLSAGFRGLQARSRRGTVAELSLSRRGCVVEPSWSRRRCVAEPDGSKELVSQRHSLWSHPSSDGCGAGGTSPRAPATGGFSLVSPQYKCYAAGSKEEKRAGGPTSWRHYSTNVLILQRGGGQIGGEGLGLACAAIPPAPPSDVFQNRGTPPVPPAGAGDPLPNLPPSTRAGTEPFLGLPTSTRGRNRREGGLSALTFRGKPGRGTFINPCGGGRFPTPRTVIPRPRSPRSSPYESASPPRPPGAAADGECGRPRSSPPTDFWSFQTAARRSARRNTRPRFSIRKRSSRISRRANAMGAPAPSPAASPCPSLRRRR